MTSLLSAFSSISLCCAEPAEFDSQLRRPVSPFTAGTTLHLSLSVYTVPQIPTTQTKHAQTRYRLWPPLYCMSCLRSACRLSMHTRTRLWSWELASSLVSWSSVTTWCFCGPGLPSVSRKPSTFTGKRRERNPFSFARIWEGEQAFRGLLSSLVTFK